MRVMLVNIFACLFGVTKFLTGYLLERTSLAAIRRGTAVTTKPDSSTIPGHFLEGQFKHVLKLFIKVKSSRQPDDEPDTSIKMV